MKWLARIVVGAALLTAVACAAEPAVQPAGDFVRLFPRVAVPLGATDRHKAEARRLADAIGAGDIAEAKINPVCCVWVEITGWTPNPGVAGYVIINQSGGSIISASDTAQLHAGVERFKKSLRKNGKQMEAPVGLMTNFPLATTPHTVQ